MRWLLLLVLVFGGCLGKTTEIEQTDLLEYDLKLTTFDNIEVNA